MFGYGQIRPGVPGDNAPADLRPEIIAQEQIILHHVDALLTWMKRTVEWTDEAADAMNHFMTNEGPNPTFRHSNDATGDERATRVTHYILNKMDPDANAIMFEIIRAAWQRRCWQTYYGERPNPHE